MNRLGSMVVLCALLVLPGGLAAAQSPPSKSARQNERASGSDESSAEIVRRAREQAASLSLRADRVRKWLGEARGKRQVARSRCLDAMLSQAHAVERQGQAELEGIEGTSASEALERRMLRLDYIVGRSRQILSQANACGKVVSKRVRAPTSYRVRLLATR